MKSLILLTFLASAWALAETKTFAVNGMTCGDCVASVQKSVCEGLKYSKENCTVEIGKVTVTGENVDPSAIEAAVKKAGFTVATNSTAASTTPEKTKSSKKKK